MKKSDCVVSGAMPPILTKLRYTVPEFIQLTGTPRSTVFQRINRQELKVVRDGRKVFITADEMIRYCNQSQPLIQGDAMPSRSPR